MTAMPSFQKDQNLEKIAKEVTRLVPMTEAASANYRIVFSDQEPERKAGQCSLVKGALHYLTGLEYVIVIYRAKFEAATEVRQILEMLGIGEEGDPLEVEADGDSRTKN